MTAEGIYWPGRPCDTVSPLYPYGSGSLRTRPIQRTETRSRLAPYVPGKSYIVGHEQQYTEPGDRGDDLQQLGLSSVEEWEAVQR